MSNVDRPRGFHPIGTLSGSPWQSSTKRFYLDGTANTIAIGVGGIVVMTAGGYLNGIAAGGGGADIMGLVVGIPPAPGTFSTTTGITDFSLSATEPTLTGADANHVNASEAGYIDVCTAPDLLMVGQEDGDTTPLTLADIGAAVDIIDGGIDATTGNSTMEIDSSSKGTTAGDPLKLLELHQVPGNELASVDTTKPWADWVCTFNNHWYNDKGGI